MKSKYTQFRSRKYPSTSVHKNTHLLMVTIQKNLARHTERNEEQRDE